MTPTRLVPRSQTHALLLRPVTSVPENGRARLGLSYAGFHTSIRHDRDVTVRVGHFDEQVMGTDYRSTLSLEASKRYSDKISLIGGIDPYKITPAVNLVVECDFPLWTQEISSRI